MPGKQDSYLLNMGERRDSRWVITLVFFLYSNYARHFTRLRHTLKGVTLHCFSLLCVVDIGWMFCRMSHCFGLFFYSGQFKSCFPHQNPDEYSSGFLLCSFYMPNVCQPLRRVLFGNIRSNGRFFARKNPLMTRLMTRK